MGILQEGQRRERSAKGLKRGVSPAPNLGEGIVWRGV
jgi:hypothetical protein